MALCDLVLTDEAQHLDTISEVDGWLLEQSRPQIFDDNSTENVLTQHRQRFGELCAALAEQGYPQPHLLSVFDFQAAVAYLTRKNSREE